MDEYEWSAEWFSDGSDSWLPMGWKGTEWTTEPHARAHLKVYNAWTPKVDTRLVRRIKAGPVEVIDEV